MTSKPRRIVDADELIKALKTKTGELAMSWLNNEAFGITQAISIVNKLATPEPTHNKQQNLLELKPTRLEREVKPVAKNIKGLPVCYNMETGELWPIPDKPYRIFIELKDPEPTCADEQPKGDLIDRGELLKWCENQGMDNAMYIYEYIKDMPSVSVGQYVGNSDELEEPLGGNDGLTVNKKTSLEALGKFYEKHPEARILLKTKPDSEGV